MDDEKKLLQIENISKSFPGVKALNNINFDLYSGEIHCLVGENGAGKSTFIKILAGAQKPDSGEIIVFNQKFRYLTPIKAIQLGIQTVYQESILVNDLTVAENILLGSEPTNKLKFFDLKKCFTQVQELIANFNIDLNPKSIVKDLSIAEKQIVGILKALSRNVKILILDEPTSSLTANEIEILVNLLKEIIKKQIGVIYISHRLEEVFKIGNRVTVFKDGEKVATHLIKDINLNDLIKEMIGRPASIFYQKEKINDFKYEKFELKIENFCGAGFIKNVSFTAESGKVFGIGGMVGSGRTELAKLIAGVEKLSSGEMFLNNKKIYPKTPLQAIKDGICLIPEDRQKSGLIIIRSIRENVTLASNSINRGFLLSLKDEFLKVNNFVKSLKIATDSIEKLVMYLSGGNQQKVVLAKWLITNCKVFIFDEPTRGIDVGAKEEIYKIISDLLKNNKIVIMISSDMPELISLSDKIGIMKDGQMVKILESEEINEEKILSYAIGVKI